MAASPDIPLARLHHLLTVPVTVGGVDSRFVLDSGIGLTLVSEALCLAAGCARTALSFTGHRMSGQEVTVPLARAGSLVFGALRREDTEVGVLDMSGFPPELAQIGGFLSLELFSAAPFTVDYPREVIVLETVESLAARRGAGTSVAIQVERDGPSLTVFCPLTVPGGRSLCVEVDMGSDELILNERLAGEVGVDLDGADVRRVEGLDETGHAFTRFFTSLGESIHPTGAPQLAQAAPDVMFQRIIYDGLIGDSFLRRFATTYDIAAAELVFSPPGGV